MSWKNWKRIAQNKTMFKPKFLIILKPEDFGEGNFVCLGSQLITIVNHLAPMLVPHFWLAADVDAYEARKYGLDSFYLTNVGDDATLIKICSEVDQFLAGVFFAIDAQYKDQNPNHIEVDTEDEQFRALDINGVLIEIRALDTSNFEVYSEDEELIGKFAKKFNK